MRSQKEINAEVALLKEMKPKIPHHSCFGDDNWEKIEAQIEVLEEFLDEEDMIAREESGDWDHDTFMSADEARMWREEEANEKPSNGWECLLPDK